jgi:ribonuclease HII
MRGVPALVAGVDEAGRGPLAGPVVAAAVLLRADHGIRGIRDSKQLSAARRSELDGEIRERALAVGLGVVGPERIDAINIRRAALEAMALAVQEVLGKELQPVPRMILVDGLDTVPLPTGVQAPPQQAFVRGDARSQAIGAASIVAKVHRDALMDQAHVRFPAYGFDRHKGYPTAEHRQAIRLRGPCEIHRRSFSGVRGVTASPPGVEGVAD